MIANNNYGGGTAQFSNIVELLCREARQIFGNDEQIVVSLGTGKVSKQFNLEHDKKLHNIVTKLAEISSEAEEAAATFVGTHSESKAFNDHRYFRFDVSDLDVDANVLAESQQEDLDRLRNIVAKYMAEPPTSAMLSTCSWRLTGSCTGSLPGVQTDAHEEPIGQHYFATDSLVGAPPELSGQSSLYHGQQSDASVNVGANTTEGHTGANDGRSHFAYASSIPETSHSIRMTILQPDLQTQWTSSHEGVAQHPAQESDSLPPQNVPRDSGYAGPRSRVVGQVRQIPIRDRAIRSRDQQSYQSAVNATTTQRSSTKSRSQILQLNKPRSMLCWISISDF